MDCIPAGSSVHGISQERILDWVALSFPFTQILTLETQTKIRAPLIEVLALVVFVVV